MAASPPSSCNLVSLLLHFFFFEFPLNCMVIVRVKLSDAVGVLLKSQAYEIYVPNYFVAIISSYFIIALPMLCYKKNIFYLLYNLHYHMGKKT